MVRQVEPGGAETDDQHLVARFRLRQRPAQVERVPAGQEAVDLEAPRQRQHVLQRAGLDLRDIDRLLPLVDAGFHAVVADAVPGRGAERVVDRDDRQRADAVAARLDDVHLRDFLVERAAVQGDPEHAFAERCRPSRASPSGSCPSAGCGTRCSNSPGRARRRGRCRDRSGANPSRGRQSSSGRRSIVTPCRSIVSTGTRWCMSSRCGTRNSRPRLCRARPAGVSVAQAAYSSAALQRQVCARPRRRASARPHRRSAVPRRSSPARVEKSAAGPPISAASSSPAWGR